MSRKDKERATDDPVAPMRLVASDDEDLEDYEAALNRMRISATQDNWRGQGDTIPRAGEPSDVQARWHDQKGLPQVATLELTQRLSDDDDSALEQTLAQSDKTKGVDGAMGSNMVDEDNGDVSTSQRPNKAKRAIVLGDMLLSDGMEIRWRWAVS
ncbi:hypothetical protein B0O80DRAFT_490311 [Mortierella sp. GBAus27b]|nr:hypothetical protein B0O80DRAFT_490311 [Mortierella sp. GBAus27b]